MAYGYRGPTTTPGASIASVIDRIRQQRADAREEAAAVRKTKTDVGKGLFKFDSSLRAWQMARVAKPDLTYGEFMMNPTAAGVYQKKAANMIMNNEAEMPKMMSMKRYRDLFSGKGDVDLKAELDKKPGPALKAHQDAPEDLSALYEGAFREDPTDVPSTFGSGDELVHPFGTRQRFLGQGSTSMVRGIDKVREQERLDMLAKGGGEIPSADPDQMDLKSEIDPSSGEPFYKSEFVEGETGAAMSGPLSKLSDARQVPSGDESFTLEPTKTEGFRGFIDRLIPGGPSGYNEYGVTEGKEDVVVEDQLADVMGVSREELDAMPLKAFTAEGESLGEWEGTNEELLERSRKLGEQDDINKADALAQDPDVMANVQGGPPVDYEGTYDDWLDDEAQRISREVLAKENPVKAYRPAEEFGAGIQKSREEELLQTEYGADAQARALEEKQDADLVAQGKTMQSTYEQELNTAALKKAEVETLDPKKLQKVLAQPMKMTDAEGNPIGTLDPKKTEGLKGLLQRKIEGGSSGYRGRTEQEMIEDIGAESGTMITGDLRSLPGVKEKNITLSGSGKIAKGEKMEKGIGGIEDTEAAYERTLKEMDAKKLLDTPVDVLKDAPVDVGTDVPGDLPPTVGEIPGEGATLGELGSKAGDIAGGVGALSTLYNADPSDIEIGDVKAGFDVAKLGAKGAASMGSKGGAALGQTLGKAAPWVSVAMSANTLADKNSTDMQKTGALMSAAGAIAMTNFWNPAGWVAGALMVGGTLASLFGGKAQKPKRRARAATGYRGGSGYSYV